MLALDLFTLQGRYSSSSVCQSKVHMLTVHSQICSKAAKSTMMALDPFIRLKIFSASLSTRSVLQKLVEPCKPFKLCIPCLNVAAQPRCAPLLSLKSLTKPLGSKCDPLVKAAFAHSIIGGSPCASDEGWQQLAQHCSILLTTLHHCTLPLLPFSWFWAEVWIYPLPAAMCPPFYLALPCNNLAPDYINGGPTLLWTTSMVVQPCSGLHQW